MADKIANKKQALLDNRVVENMLDNQLLQLIQELPDPDVILRKANIDQDVYNEILSDPHVIGEVRSQRSGMLSFKYEIKPGDESAQAQKAKELCEEMMEKRLDGAMSWMDIHWSIAKTPLVGRRVHHVQWEKDGPYLIPSRIFDISTQSYCFNLDGNLLIRTTDNPQGEEAEQYRWLVTRHMPERENPYGRALLSTCFWPWMFKNGGIKFFVKFCEKFGVPWPVGKYPVGSSDEDIDELVERMQSMVEDAVAAIPEGVEMSLMETSVSGEIVQERLANFMNKEMSKALTSQSLATEINSSGGSRAAAETHNKRTELNQKTDRILVADTKNQLFAMITEVNFGEDVAPPIMTYIDKKELNTADVSYFASAAKLVPIKRDEIYKRLELSIPDEGDDVVFFGQDKNEDKDPKELSQFAKGDEFNDEDQAISDIVDKVKAAINSGDSLEDALDKIAALMPELEKDALNDLMRNELELEFGKGMLDA